MDFGPFGIGVAPEHLQQQQQNLLRMFMAQHQQQQPPSQPQQGGNQPGEADAGQRGSEQPQQNSERPQGQSGNDSGDAQQQPGGDSPVLMHNAAHTGVICDICNSEIKGFRYKCMQCPDFDLCSKCEHKGHHAGHVMMRISFPEQTRDAIRKYLSNCPPSPPPHGRHGHPHHGHGSHPFAGPHHGPEGFPFVFGRRPGHCGRRSQRHEHGQEQNSGSDDERPTTAPGKKMGKFFMGGRAGRIDKRCPYNMGKKEFKKWSKWVKRAAQHQHRSAEAYSRAAAAAGENGGPSASAGAGAAAPESPVDFQAVASQIQEFLNYFGIPVDVVELYDQLGNRGGQSNETQNQQSTSQGTGEQAQTSTGTQEGTSNNGANAATATPRPSTQEQPPASPAAANLSENMQQMRIDEVQNVSGRQDESLLMDLDAENSGWTILNNQSREQTPSNTVPVATPEGQQPSAPQGPDAANANGSPQQGTPTESMNSNSGNGNTPFASMGSNASIGKSPSAPSAPSYPSGIPNVPLYPVLNQPQIQQILQNVSSAVNSVVRSIPIVTDPRGPVGTKVTSATNGQVPATGTETSDGQDVQLDGRCMKTLNQLLAMGFSNEGGYLTRLVIAKNGDLEAVLSSLFPN